MIDPRRGNAIPEIRARRSRHGRVRFCFGDRESCKRGTVLGAFLLLLPIVMALLLTALTQIDVAVGETRRHQQRTQARLLAESALAAYHAAQAKSRESDAAASHLPLRGPIEGIGTYTAERAEAEEQSPGPGNEGGLLIRARGEVAAAKNDAAGGRVTCQILARTNRMGASPRPYQIGYSRHAR